jgi:hypothetical protein
MEFEGRHFQFKHPFTATVAGPTGCGKTVLVRNILESLDQLIDAPGHLRIIWAYGVFQEGYNKPFKNQNITVDYVEGMPTADDGRYDILVVDDLMSEVGGNKNLSNVFTKGSHHDNVSVIFIVQNLFYQALEMRTMSLNSQYIILMKNRRDLTQISTFARQIYPRNVKFFMDAYQQALEMNDYGYILFDARADTPESLRLRTNITPDKFPTIVFTPKNV